MSCDSVDSIIFCHEIQFRSEALEVEHVYKEKNRLKLITCKTYL